MARRPSKLDTQTIPNALSDNLGSLLRTVIGKVSTDGTIDVSSLALGTLLLNPESIDDEKTSNWVANQIPGQADPIFQWTSGGPRVVSFDALITKDTSDFLNIPPSPWGKLADKAINAVGAIASNFLGVTVTASTFTDVFSSGATGEDGNDLSIEDNLNYFRSLMYPTYEAGRLATSPPVVVLYIGSTLSTAKSDPDTDKINSDTDLWVLLDLKIKITKQLPNLAPMEAVVSFRFNQYTTKSFGSDHFQQGNLPGITPSLPTVGFQ